MRYVLINGAMRDETEAVIPVTDRGFRYGDGMFETVPIHDSMPYLWDYHLERLSGGLAALRIEADISSLLPRALALLEANAVQEGLLRLQISRGTGGRGYLPSRASLPTMVMETLKRPEPVSSVTLWRSRYARVSPRALPTQFKLAHGLSSTLARLEAAEQGCDDALQLAEDASVSEAASANIFWRRDGRLYTPSLECGALAGVTRRRVMELSTYPVSEGEYALEELLSADAVILTNAASGAMAVNGLLPGETRWQSLELAAEINNIRQQDIRLNTLRLRESLAPS